MTSTHQESLTPIPLMELSTAYWAYKTFATAVLEFDLFSVLAERPGRTLSQLADDLRLPARSARVFIAALTSLGLLDHRAGKYYNAPISDMFLVKDRPYYFGGFVGFLDTRYERWHDIGTAVRKNQPLTFDSAAHESVFTSADRVMMRHFWEAMHSISTFTARALAEAYDLSTHSKILDVGGGSGAFPIELCRAYPHLRGTVYDLAYVGDIAATKIAAAGLSDRIGTMTGDFVKDAALPSDHDVIVLSSILHDWDADSNRRLLRKCHEALPKGGVVLICEIVMNDDYSGPPDSALMGMHMLMETPGGQNYSGAEYADWLTEAGFTAIDRLPLTAAGANAVIVGQKTR